MGTFDLQPRDDNSGLPEEVAVDLYIRDALPPGWPGNGGGDDDDDDDDDDDEEDDD